MPVALLALAIGAFGIGTTEFVMMGLLPEVADTFAVSISSAGHLVSAYAVGVVIGAPLLTALAVRLRRKRMLTAMMGLFAAGNLASALAPTDAALLAFRFLAGLPHGAFFGSGAIVAAGTVPPERRTRATATMFSGLTIANILGVPAGTLLGQQLGWRFTFGLVAAIGVVAGASILWLLPAERKPAGASLRRELGSFRNPQVWLVLATVTFGLGGTFACLSYITPIMTRVAGFPATSMTLLLALFGAGMTVGNFLGGKLADRAPMRTLCGALLGLAAMLALFTLTAHAEITAAVSIFLIGATGMAIGPILQTRIMEKAAGAPTLAAAAIQSGFNIANSIGAYLGGAVIAAGLGLVAPSWLGALLALTGLLLALVSGLVDRRTAARDAAAEPDPAPEPATHPEPVPA